jgi:xanthine dehydrogenase accessory factor
VPELWQHALKSVRAGHPAVLVVVVDCIGSVPGKTGAKMVVSPLGFAGTVGGGVAEKEMIDRAQEHPGKPEIVHFVHSEETDSLCAGRQTLALMALGAADVPVLESIIRTIGDEAGFGTVLISGGGLSFTAGQKRATRFAEHSGGWVFEETLGRLETLHIVGGGHVSLALSRVMATLPFRIVVLDNREELPTMQSNIHAHSTRVIDYDAVADHVAEGDLSYAVIMTHGHRDDERVLEKLVGQDLRYLGMMGSPVKVKQLFANLEQKGVTRVLLDRVHSPVGVDIGSHTPEEIAISIAAEIIKVRNRH